MFAHSRNAAGQRHLLLDHLTGTAQLTAEFAEPLGARDLGWYLGLWHDIGKFDPEWQDYLLKAEAGRATRGSGPDHKAAGASLMARAAGLSFAALVIQGHHGGLQKYGEFKGWLQEKEQKAGAAEALKLARATVPDLEPSGRIAIPPHLEGQARGREAEALARSSELFARLMFSALVDADSLDTEHHGSPDRTSWRGNTGTLEQLWTRFDAAGRERRPSSSSVVQEARDAILDACTRAADLPPGLFRLAAPTGGGKTLAGMAFALRHALKHRHRRIIVAVPYISITEQTAQVYRAVFGESDDGRPIVLEHHSSSRDLIHEATEPDDGDFRPEALWSQLAAENWEAPIVVTTTVQLFESLFGRTRTACRKLHRLANAVIILDEVQALPVHLLDPMLDVLRELCAFYGTTVLLSTATQPAFDSIPAFRDLPATDIIQAPGPLFRSLERVQYDWRTETPLSWAEVAQLLLNEQQALVILNTKNDALAILDALRDLDIPDVRHLSTLLCGAHRRAVLEEIRVRLAAGQRCILVSTQVVEAGVDLDFPLVLRALGPLDGIIQAAGRCNREGKLGIGTRAGGRVIVFRPADGGMPPGAYRRGQQVAESLMTEAAYRGRQLDPNDPDLFRRYSQQLLSLTTTDAARIQRLRQSLDYPEVSRAFRMIDDDTESLVITGYGSDEEQQTVRTLLDGLRHPASATVVPRVALRQLQPFTVTVRRRLAKQYHQRGLIDDVHPGQRTDISYGIAEWHGRYDSIRGLVAEGASADTLVV